MVVGGGDDEDAPTCRSSVSSPESGEVGDGYAEPGSGCVRHLVSTCDGLRAPDAGVCGCEMLSVAGG